MGWIGLNGEVLQGTRERGRKSGESVGIEESGEAIDSSVMT